MRMLAVLLVACGIAFAAPWDGTKGPLAIATFTFSSGTGTNLPGVPVVAGPLVWHTTMFVASSDVGVSAVRVRLVYRDSSGEHIFSQIVDLVNGHGGVTLSIKPEQ